MIENCGGTMTKSRSLALVALAYILAIGVAATWLTWGPATGRLWLDTLIADVLATVVVFAFSRAYRNSSFYDAYWSVIPPLLTFYWWSQAGPGVDQPRCWLVAVVVVLWAIRLTANWVYAFPGLHHEDWRYPMFRERAGRWEFVADFVAIHLIPTVQVFVGMLPVYVCVTHPGGGIRWLTTVAFLVGLAAVTIELVVRRATASVRRQRATRRSDGSWVMGLVAASKLLRGVQFLVRLGVVRRGRFAVGRVVVVRRRANDAGHAPGRQHSVDGDPQPATPTELSASHRPGATLRPKAPTQDIGRVTTA